MSFTVTAKLICIFVFAYADCWFSYEDFLSFNFSTLSDVLLQPIGEDPAVHATE